MSDFWTQLIIAPLWLLYLAAFAFTCAGAAVGVFAATSCRPGGDGPRGGSPAPPCPAPEGTDALTALRRIEAELGPCLLWSATVLDVTQALHKSGVTPLNFR